MTRWPEAIRKAVLMCLAHEVPTLAMIRRNETDDRQAARDLAALMRVVDAYAEEYRICCDAIDMPCQSDAEAATAAMGRIRLEVARYDGAAPLEAKDEARRAPLEDLNAQASIDKDRRVRALADNLRWAGVHVRDRMTPDDWACADPDGTIWRGLSAVTIKRDKQAVKALLKA